MAVGHVAVLVQEVQRAKYTVAAGEESHTAQDAVLAVLDSCS